MKVKIPERDLKQLNTLLALPADGLSRILEALRSLGPSLGFVQLSKQLAERSGVKQEAAGDVLYILRTLYNLRDRLHLTETEFINEIDGALLAVSREHPPAADRENLTNFIREALSLANFEIIAKGVSLLNEFERKYCSARMLTDLRPVFAAELTKGPVANLLVHTLGIAYHEGSQMKEFFLALDSNDVREMRDLLERAITKERLLEERASSAGLPLLKG